MNSEEKAKSFNMDGYYNMLNKYGTRQDNQTAYDYLSDPFVDDMTLVKMYEGNGLFSTVIDRPAEEATKHGFDIDFGKEEVSNYIYERMDDIGFEEQFTTAIKWSRLYGGAIGVLIINDGKGLEEPLDKKNVTSIEEIRVFERPLVQPDYQTMYSPANGIRPHTAYREPEYFDVFSIYGTFRVHRSRCLVFRNGRLPEQATNENYRYWGIPEYIRVRDAIRECITSHHYGVQLLEKSSQAVYSMKNLANYLSTDAGENQIIKRLQIIDMARSMMNTIAIDADGEMYDFKTMTMAGAKDLIDTTCNMLSAVTHIPQTILFGRSPAGENATGESDMENYYNMVENIQKQNMKRNSRLVIDLIIKQGIHDGDIEKAPKYKVSFAKLWSMSDSEQASVEQTKAQTELTKAQAVQIYSDLQAVDPTEIRDSISDNEDLGISVDKSADSHKKNLESIDIDPDDLDLGIAIDIQDESKEKDESFDDQNSEKDSHQAEDQEIAEGVDHEEDIKPDDSEMAIGEETEGSSDTVPSESEVVIAKEMNNDASGGDWVTINGTHVLIGKGGKAESGGNLVGKDFSSAKSEKHEAKGKSGGGVSNTPNKTANVQRSKASGSHDEPIGEKYIPEDTYRNQGLNTQRRQYLSDKGYSEKDIGDFESLVKGHVQGRNVQGEMEEFVQKHPDLVEEVANYEAQAASMRQKQDIAEAEKNLKAKKAELSEEIPDWMASTEETRQAIKEEREEAVRKAQQQLDTAKGDIRLYRAGKDDKEVLSFTPNPDGVTLNAGTEAETQLSPDHSATLSELRKQGIVPVSGFGAIDNMYEDEVTFVRLPKKTETGSTEVKHTNDPKPAKPSAAEQASVSLQKPYGEGYSDTWTDPDDPSYTVDLTESKDIWLEGNKDQLVKNWKERRAQGIKEKPKDFEDHEYTAWKMSKLAGNEKEMPYEEASETLYDAIPQNVFHGWFTEANSEYKPKLVDAVTKSPEVRSAALSMMFNNYKYFHPNSDMTFDEFLNSPMTMYRGGHGQNHTENDVFSAYTWDKSIAEKFAGKGGKVYEAHIKPINTYGSVNDAGESEIMVPSVIAPNGNKDSRTDADTDNGVGIIVVKDGKFLVGTRQDGYGICSAGGHIKDEETPQEAAKREAYEEFGIVPLTLIPIGETKASSGLYCNSTVFLCDSYSGKIDTDEEEMTSPRFMTMDELCGVRLYEPFKESLVLMLDVLFGESKRIDASDGGWITVNGAHIPIGKNGKAIGGPLKGKDFSNSKSISGKKSKSSKGLTTNRKTAKMKNTTKTPIDQISPTGKNILKHRGFKSEQHLNNHWMNGRTHREEYEAEGLDKSGYEKRAVELAESAADGVKIRGYRTREGYICRYDVEKNDYVKADIDKGIRTMFKPDNGVQYYEDLKHAEGGDDNGN